MVDYSLVRSDCLLVSFSLLVYVVYSRLLVEDVPKLGFLWGKISFLGSFYLFVSISPSFSRNCPTPINVWRREG